jgi:hypoxanthine phosphoribosyltransferase
MMIKKITYNWKEFNQAVEFLSKKLSKNKQLRNIYAIPRGGLPLGVSLSHRLNLPIIMNETEISPQTLVVDDIFDTGKTITNLASRRSFSNCAFWFKNIQTELPKNLKIFYYKTKKPNEWIVFPWETLKTTI